jgi:hypothetical protein
MGPIGRGSPPTDREALDDFCRQQQSSAAAIAERRNQEEEKKPTQNASAFDLRHELEGISRVDLTRIDGIEVMVAQTVLSEVGRT